MSSLQSLMVTWFFDGNTYYLKLKIIPKSGADWVKQISSGGFGILNGLESYLTEQPKREEAEMFVYIAIIPVKSEHKQAQWNEFVRAQLFGLTPNSHWETLLVLYEALSKYFELLELYTLVGSSLITTNEGSVRMAITPNEDGHIRALPGNEEHLIGVGIAFVYELTEEQFRGKVPLR